jgi:hypothetical protein
MILSKIYYEIKILFLLNFSKIIRNFLIIMINQIHLFYPFHLHLIFNINIFMKIYQNIKKNFPFLIYIFI